LASSSRGVPVDAVEAAAASPTKVEVSMRGFLGVLGQVALEVLPPLAIAGPLDLAFQLAVMAFVLVHDEVSWFLWHEDDKAVPTRVHRAFW
jgi:hypothetical protein